MADEPMQRANPGRPASDGQVAEPAPESGSEPGPGASDDKPDPPAALLEDGGLAPSADPVSSMASRFNLFFRWFGRRFFGHFDLDPRQVERLRSLEGQGAVVYVMRYSSRLDYLLFNWLFLREGLRLSSFANGIVFYYYKPLFTVLKRVFTRRRGAPLEIKHSEDQTRARSLVRERGSFFLFLRTRRLRTFVRGVRGQPQRRDELDLLLEVVQEAREGGTPVSVVPLSIFWRKGPRRQGRFLNLDYGSLARPSDLAKVTSFLAQYRSLSVKVGDPIDLTGFAESRPEDSPERLARTVRRSILIHLYREEKVVVGPTLRSPQHVLREVLEDRGVRSAMSLWARAHKSGPDRAEREVEKMVGEIAARMNSTLLAVMAAAASMVFRRLFTSIETKGLERVAEVAKRHPVVLVPSHRSYFDFLIVSWLFYRNYLVPPHIAARDNMAFGPFGLLFRASGAFYLRKSFEDPLYKQVFRAYVAYLVREGYNQEFFIEGGRSRTGKTLAPRLGMLTWDVDAFLESSRRDLYFVPIAITYERLVEESGMVGELEGEAKTEESMLSLFKARKVLERRFGSVHVNFGEPMSLARALGDSRDRFADSVRDDIDRVVSGEVDATASPEPVEEERRVFIDELGHRLVERINWSVVVNSTSVAAAVLLGGPHRGLRRPELVERMQQIVSLLAIQGADRTAALEADKGDFSESITFLLRADLIKEAEGGEGDILFYDPSRRRALDLYRNSLVHYLTVPSVLARSVLHGATRAQISDDVAFWCELLYRETYVPVEERTEERIDAFLGHFQREGWIEREDGVCLATAKGEPLLQCLERQSRGALECYEATFRAVLEASEPLEKKALQLAAQAAFERAVLLGEADCAEAASPSIFENAAQLLCKRGVLELVDMPAPEAAARKRFGRKRRTKAPARAYAPGEREAELEPLLERLATARGAR